MGSFGPSALRMTAQGRWPCSAVILSEAKDPTEQLGAVHADRSPEMVTRGPFHVYIVTGLSLNRVLYVGVTSNLAARIEAHRLGRFDGFTARYHLSKLVYAETFR